MKKNYDNPMQLKLELQLNPVADEVSAITAVVQPILKGLLYSLKKEIVDEVGGYDKVKLMMLPRLYRPGDRDCGICFEYAVHEALTTRQPSVLERLDDALKQHCRMTGDQLASLLFGVEKAGALNLINTVKDQLTDESRLLAGTRGQPARLKHHIDSLAAAFRKKEIRDTLPWSISGTWKADLFVGFADTDRWVATTVKVNPKHLESARGLRIGIIPTLQGKSDLVRLDESRNLVICPLPYDGDFMEVFYDGWVVVKQFIAADAALPTEVNLPIPADRQVARYLVQRRDYPVVDVIEALKTISQPELLQTEEREAELVNWREAPVKIETGMVVAPIARETT